jgi:hypothetical protein
VLNEVLEDEQIERERERERERGGIHKSDRLTKESEMKLKRSDSIRQASGSKANKMADLGK